MPFSTYFMSNQLLISTKLRVIVVRIHLCAIYITRLYHPGYLKSVWRVKKNMHILTINLFSFFQLESLVQDMQDKVHGVPVRHQKVFLTSIPFAFMGKFFFGQATKKWCTCRLTLIGMREGTLHSLSFLDRIFWAEYLPKVFKLFWRWKLTSIGLIWHSVKLFESYKKCPSVVLKMSIVLAFIAHANQG